MEQSIITFRADEQELTKTGGVDKFASSTVAYVEAHFTLGENWTGFDSVRAMWRFGSDVMATVLAIEDGVGTCQVPHELLERRGELKVNLVGSIVEDEVISDRLTTYPIVALIITKVALVTSDETEVTPSQFEQYVAITNEAATRAETARDEAEDAQTASETAQAKAEQAQEYAETAQSKAEEAQAKAEQAQASAEQAQGESEDYSLVSEGWAKGTQNGVAVESGSPYYEDNAEYYKNLAEQAEQSILDLTGSASVDNTVGTPSVTVTVTNGETKNMDFAFHNLKGEKGNVLYASFYVDYTDMSLHMVTPDEYDGTTFYLEGNALYARIN